MRSIIVPLTLVAALATACSSTPTFQTGEDAEVTFDGLTRLDRTVLDVVWAREDIDLTRFSKIMFEDLGVEYRPSTGPYSGRAGTTNVRRTNARDFQLNDDQRAAFEAEISAAFLDEMGRSERFQIVEEKGDDVLLVRIGLLDVVSMVPPDTIGRSQIFLDRVGEATLVLEIHDSVSNAIYARAVDRRAAQSQTARESNQVTNRAEVRRLGRRWGTIIRDGLDSLLGGDAPS